MTVLAVVGLFTTLAMSRLTATKEDLIERIRQLESIRQALVEQLEKVERERQANQNAWAQERLGLQQQVQEAARNQEMFRAIQEAQKFIDEISHSSGLTFGVDQSLQFGDDLVSFELNSVEPKWKADSRERLRRFCLAISNQRGESLAAASSITDRFIVQVEGHTDSLGCPDHPSCNWWISSQRAAAFVALMRQQDYCPGGSDWHLRPIGYADTKPEGLGKRPTRRIAVKLVPNYEGLIKMPTLPRP